MEIKISIKKRKGTRFIKEVEHHDKMAILKCFNDGIFEIGEFSVKFYSRKEIDKMGKV